MMIKKIPWWFGAGFGIAFVVVVGIFLTYFFQPRIERGTGASGSTVHSPPRVQEQKRFLGSTSITSSEFSRDKRDNSLAQGPGEIIGQARENDRPVVGLKLHLALNGSVMSPWTTTNNQGSYFIRVPYGEYRIDGYEIDFETANVVLNGKIGHPQNAHSSTPFRVAQEEKGKGLNFRFVEPIKKILPKTRFSLAENVVISWEPYPGAAHYEVQIYEKSDPHAYVGRDAIFDWVSRPKVTDTSFDLNKHGVQMKANHFYFVEIHAHGPNRAILSHTGQMLQGYDFEVTS